MTLFSLHIYHISPEYLTYIFNMHKCISLPYFTIFPLHILLTYFITFLFHVLPYFNYLFYQFSPTYFTIFYSIFYHISITYFTNFLLHILLYFLSIFYHNSLTYYTGRWWDGLGTHQARRVCLHHGLLRLWFTYSHRRSTTLCRHKLVTWFHTV